MTTKQLNEKAFNYILSCIDGDNYGRELTTDKDKLQFLADTFKSEYCYPENLKYYGSYSKTFENWLMGLPSCFNVDFTNFDILRIAKDWGSLTENATEKQEDKIISNWFNLITNKTFQLMKKYNVLPY